MKMLSKFSHIKGTINNTVLNILLIFYYNVIKTLKRKYMLNLKSSDKTQKCYYACKCNQYRLDSRNICPHSSPYLFRIAWLFLSC